MNLETTIIQFMILYFANLILDYPLQGNFLATGKQESNYLLWVHSSMWGIGLSLLLLPLGLFTWWKVLMLVCGHFLIDYWKARHIYQNISDDTAFLMDQFLHVVQVVLCLI